MGLINAFFSPCLAELRFDSVLDEIDSLMALKVMSALGLDMIRWPTGKHFASWLGLCPGNKLSGGKCYRMRSKPSANRAATALRLVAQGVANSHSALSAYYRRMRARLGAPKAITAESVYPSSGKIV